MKARVTYIQKTKNPSWDIVHCLSSDSGKVAIALCKSGVCLDDFVHVISKTDATGKWTSFATVIEG